MTKVPRIPFVIFLIVLAVLAIISVFFLPHVIDGDAVTYVDAIHVMNGMPLSQSVGFQNYVVHRIMTTFLGLQAINGISFITGSIESAWLLWATLIYFLTNILFYKLLERMFKSELTACIGGLFFAANYSMLIFGLTYFMDMGGWFFYVLSIYFLYRYIESANRRELWIAALALSAGGFFKESALFGYIPLFFVVFYEHRRSFGAFLRQIIPFTLVAFVPTFIHYGIIYIQYNENYLAWVHISKTAFVYSSRIIEYIKSFGSLLNFLAPISIAGLIVLLREIFVGSPVEAQKKRGKLRLLLANHPFLNNEKIVFIAGVLVSSIPAVMWPGITQRVLFMVVPGLVILAGFFIRRYEKHWYLFGVVLVAYALMSIFMDSFVLNFVNLPF